jgi:two-component system sensor histidine kinase HydH
VAETIFQEMKRLVRFGPEDERLLGLLAPHAAPHFGEIAEAFYRRLEEHDNARRVFTDPAQIERLKQSLRGWMSTLLSGPWDESFFQSRVRVGRVHVNTGVALRYVSGAMDFVREKLTDIAAVAFTGAEPRFPVVAGAINKVLNLDLTINLHAYSEAQVEQVRQLEQQRMAALRTLTAGLAHEVRNPLNAAHLQLAVAHKRLADASPEVAEAAAAVAVADDELMRLAALVDEFLEFASPRPLQRQPHNLRTLVEGVVDSHAGDAAAGGAKILLHPGESATVAIDASKVEQAIRNLVKNAVEASGAGGQVAVRLIPAQDHVLLEVEDDGPGLSAPVARLMEPFFTTKNLGTGLGLSLVQRVVADHGGALSAERRNARTVFTIRLPR